MMQEEDGIGSNTFHYNQFLFHQHQQDHMLMQPPLITPSSNFDQNYNNSFLNIQPPPSVYSYGCTYSNDNQYMMSNLTDDQEALFVSGSARRSSSLLRNMLNHEYEKMKSMDMMEDKALAASRSHSEAERRRRERINSHLTQLRSLLPNTTKTDKASLLAEVIQHVKDLKQQTSSLPEFTTFPTDYDDLAFETCTTQDGQLMLMVSLCCEDRADIVQDLIKTFQAININTVKANMTTLAGRMKYVVFIIVGDSDQVVNQTCGEMDTTGQHFIKTVQEAIRGVMRRSLRRDDNGSRLEETLKRRRIKGRNEQILDEKI